MADLNDWYPSAQPSLGSVATGGRMGNATGAVNGSPGANATASLSGTVGGSVGAPAAWVLGLVALSLLLLHLE